jgi:hypothetical protein
MAAELLGVNVSKMREWANAFLYYKTPVIREGSRFYFSKDALLKWADTTDFKKIKADYIKNSTLNKERLKAAEARREAERLEKEAKKKARLEKKMESGKVEKKTKRK